MPTDAAVARGVRALSAVLITGATGQVGGDRPRTFWQFVKDRANRFAAGLAHNA